MNASTGHDPGPRRLLDAIEYQERERRRVSSLARATHKSLRQQLVAAYYRIFDRRKKN